MTIRRTLAAVLAATAFAAPAAAPAQPADMHASTAQRPRRRSTGRTCARRTPPTRRSTPQVAGRRQRPRRHRGRLAVGAARDRAAVARSDDGTAG
jgi:Ni/Co efflux regulator RcnB